MTNTRALRPSSKIGRRRFLQLAGGTVAYVGIDRQAWPFAQSPTNIRKFVVNLPGLGPSGANQIGQYIPLATKTTASFAGLSTDIYRLGVKQFGERMHPDLKKSTTFWGILRPGDRRPEISRGGHRGQPRHANPAQRHEPAAQKGPDPVRSHHHGLTNPNGWAAATEQDCNPPSRWAYPVV